jgi:hypothetical protein
MVTRDPVPDGPVLPEDGEEPHHALPGWHVHHRHEVTGLLNEDSREKEAFTTCRLMITRLDHFSSVTRLTDSQYRFDFPGKVPVYVLWCDTGSCPVPAEISGTVRVTDYQGREVTTDAGQVRLTESPVFVEPLSG